MQSVPTINQNITDESLSPGTSYETSPEGRLSHNGRSVSILTHSAFEKSPSLAFQISLQDTNKLSLNLPKNAPKVNNFIQPIPDVATPPKREEKLEVPHDLDEITV